MPSVAQLYHTTWMSTKHEIPFAMCVLAYKSLVPWAHLENKDTGKLVSVTACFEKGRKGGKLFWKSQ